MITPTTNSTTNELLSEQHYYPFGLAMNGPWVQAGEDGDLYRYNGKELNEELGLYDYGARWYDPAIGRFTTIDPLADKYSEWSPYNYVLGNTISNTDPTGTSVETDYYNQAGKYLGTDGNDNGKVVVVTDKAEAKSIARTNKSGGVTPESSVSSGLLLPPASVRAEMGQAVDRSDSPSSDDREGGFHEEVGVYGTDENDEYQVRHAKPGTATEPDAGNMATVVPDDAADPNAPIILREGSFHVHPGGTRRPVSSTIGGQIRGFSQDPTDPQDFQEASNYPGNSYILGAKGKVTIYNGSGVLGTFPLNKFISIGNEK